MEKAHTDPLTPTKKGGPFGFWTSLKLWQKIIIALILGVVVGAVLGPSAEYIKPIGSLFINLIKMLIVPLIFSSSFSRRWSSASVRWTTSRKWAGSAPNRLAFTF
jgi:hypothetical protein